MDPDRWRQVERVLDVALAVEPSQWSEVLDACCSNDSELRKDVEDLLGRMDGAHDFLVTLPGAIAAALIDESQPIESQSPQEGRRIGAFSIVREIGRGGMSRVFLAERADGQYKQQVALKLLRPGFDSDVDVVRFRAERQILASLNHPNIARLLDGGVTDEGLPYLVLEHIDGQPIDRYCKDRNLSTRQRLELFLSVADAVQYAHHNSVVHRDLKPSNILVTPDGTVKLLDFGVAKMLEEGAASETSAAPTRFRWLTPEYAAPEQIRGAFVSARTDVYQLGAVLYELLAGQTPFGGHARTTHELETAALECEPEPLDSAVHSDLSAIVLKALRKAPEDRYDSANDFAQDIRRYLNGHPVHARRRTLWYRTVRLAARRKWQLLGTAVVAVVLFAAVWLVAWPRAVHDQPSVLVLPFANLTRDPANDYFGNGLTEEVTARLSTLEGVKVISLTSAMQYKGSTKSLRQIARELNVAHVVEGSVQQSNGRLRITAQLIDAHEDKRLWAQTYDYELKDVLRVQEEIATQVVHGLDVKLGERERRILVRHGTQDPEAYELYRRGRSVWGLRTKKSHEQALDFYRRAIERDSSYGDAYAAIADAYLTGYQHNLSDMPEAEVYSRLKWAAERALALDEQSAEAHTSFAMALWWQQNWPGAERELRRSLELNPGDGLARSWYSLLLAGMGRSEEALRQVRPLNERDPFGVLSHNTYGWHCYLARDYDCAILQYGRAVELDPSWAAGYSGLGLAYAHKRRSNEAIAALHKAVDLAPQRPDFLGDLAYVQALAGKRTDALESLQRAKQQPREGFNIARAYVALGQRDSAFAWLDRSSWRWPHRAARMDPALDPLRSDARFTQLSVRIDRAMGIQ